MITTLTGPNSFSLQTALRQLTAAFVTEHGDLALERLAGEEASLERIAEALRSLPFLASKKMIILREPSKQKLFTEHAEQFFSELPETTDVIIIEPKLDKRHSYYKFLHAKTEFKDFTQLDEANLARWLVEQATAQGAALNLSDARYLIQRIGLDQQLLASEIDKLALYAASITKQSIDALTEATPQSTVFQLLEAAFAGRQQRVAELYNEQRALKVEPQQIIAMLAWQLHAIALVKTATSRSPDEVAKQAKLSPYVVKKSQAIARNLSLDHLKQLIADLLSIDTRAKRTNLNLDDALQLYFLKLQQKRVK